MTQFRKVPKRDADGNKIFDENGRVVTVLVELTADELAAYNAALNKPDYALKESAMDALHAYVDEFAAKITGDVPIDEKLSWPAKEAAAQALTDGTETTEQLALLKDEADLTGETPVELAAIVLGKAAVYRLVVSRIAGLRRATVAAIEAADTAQDAKAYDTILSAAKAQAETLAAGLGL